MLLWKQQKNTHLFCKFWPIYKKSVDVPPKLECYEMVLPVVWYVHYRLCISDTIFQNNSVCSHFYAYFVDIWHLQAVLELNVSIFVDVPPELQRHEMVCLFHNFPKGNKIKLIFAEIATQPHLFPFCLEFSFVRFDLFVPLFFFV